ncbi:MAG: ABC transporter permease [Candidatus Omnitrophica bacterium]|nr:ABC transporter permease [Candidatus Omnitrophota bacterium]
MSRRLIIFIGPLLVIITWFLVTIFKLIDPLILPLPSEVLSALIKSLGTGEIYSHIFWTYLRVTLGLIIALIIGIPLGILMGYSERIYKSFEFLVDFFRSIPPIVLIPLFMTIFGIGDKAKIFIVGYSCGLVLVVNTMYGVRHSDKTRLLLAKNLKANLWQTLIKFVFPEALPGIYAGLRISLSRTCMVVIASEMIIGAKYGLGEVLIRYHLCYETAKMYTIIIIVGVISYFINKIFVVWEERLLHWTGK